MKKLFIHIGRAKTGSSALQRFLATNKESLSLYGFKYADTGFFYDTHHPLSWALHKKVYLRGDGKYWLRASKYAVQEKEPKEYWKVLRNEIEKSTYNSFIISSEEFGVVIDLHLTAQLLAEYLTGLDVKFIVYFRRQDEFLQSLYNEAVKWDESRFTGGFWD